MPQPIQDLARFLVGQWRIRRRMLSLYPRAMGAAQGTARFSPQPGGLEYSEAVEVDYDGHRGQARRAYRYRLGEPGLAWVDFEDGRFFHALDLRMGHWRAEHHCGDDLYRGGFRVLGSGAWIARWRVVGPRKNQLITTLYERLPVRR